MTIEYCLLVLAGTVQDYRARLETLVRVILPLLALKCVERSRIADFSPLCIFLVILLVILSLALNPTHFIDGLVINTS